MFLSWPYFPILIFSAIIYWALPKQRNRNLFLTAVSLAFIYWFDKNAVIVVIGLTLFTFLIAWWIEKSQGGKLAHTIGIVGLLLVLAIFKYLGFLSGTLNSLFSFVHQLPVFQFEKLFLPLGISYITFKYISYLTDIQWGLFKKGNFLDLLCYGSLFTIFAAGPIERFDRMKPQFESDKIVFKLNYVEVAFERIIFGLFQKQILADRLAEYTLQFWYYPTTYTLVSQIIVLFGYALQMYLDFSGYSSIAIGSSRLFGLTIMENFNNPYLASNISQFWRRWHISLSEWIRDYIFFPLYQYKSYSFWLFVCVPIIAMALCGLWHGASWNYVLWGIWHGVGIAIYHYWNKYKKKHKKFELALNTPIISRTAILVTFFYVSLGGIIFRTTNLGHLTNLFFHHGEQELSIRGKALILVLLLCIFLVPNYHKILQKISMKRYYPYVKWFVLFVIIESIFFLSPATSALFIYAGF